MALMSSAPGLAVSEMASGDPCRESIGAGSRVWPAEARRPRRAGGRGAGRQGRQAARGARRLDDQRDQLNRFSETGPDGLVFIGPSGGRLLRRNFHRLWTKALTDAEIQDEDVHFHDLRHTQGTSRKALPPAEFDAGCGNCVWRA